MTAYLTSSTGSGWRRKAEASGSVGTAAMVAHAHYIDPGKFGVRAARDAGLQCDVFTEHDDAIAWLLART